MANYTVLECKYGSGIYADDHFQDENGKVVKPVLKFRNGRASVSESRLKELEKHPKYGIEFGKIGTIVGAYGLRSVTVTRSESRDANADDSRLRIEDNRLGSPRQRAQQLEAELAKEKK